MDKSSEKTSEIFSKIDVWSAKYKSNESISTKVCN